MAVYTQVSTHELADFLTRYDVGTLRTAKGIAEGVENSNYLISTEQSSFILTLYEKRVEAADLPFFLGLMDHLADRGLACPRPIKDKSGQALQELSGRPACLISFLDGVSIDVITPAHCASLGAALADFHVKGADFAIRRTNALGPDGWSDLAARILPRLDEIEPGLAALVADSLKDCRAAWPADLPAGVIHADLFPDNVFFLGERLSGLIDFYFACNDLYAYDLAVCINAWCFDGAQQLDTDLSASLVQAYGNKRGLGKEEVAALPILCEGAALRFLLTRAHDWLHHDPNALVRPHDPLAFARRLEAHRAITDARPYGA